MPPGPPPLLCPSSVGIEASSVSPAAVVTLALSAVAAGPPPPGAAAAGVVAVDLLALFDVFLVFVDFVDVDVGGGQERPNRRSSGRAGSF